VVHSYRHRYGLAPGDPAVEATEKQLAARSRITVPTVVLHGGDNNVAPVKSSEAHAVLFSGPFERRVIPRTGHNVPQEAPREFAAAVLSLAHAEAARS
jgi:pimeloyl-ACP methyl ester carboxylesterase